MLAREDHWEPKLGRQWCHQCCFIWVGNWSQHWGPGGGACFRSPAVTTPLLHYGPEPKAAHRGHPSETPRLAAFWHAKWTGTDIITLIAPVLISFCSNGGLKMFRLWPFCVPRDTFSQGVAKFFTTSPCLVSLYLPDRIVNGWICAGFTHKTRKVNEINERALLRVLDLTI